MASLLPQTSPHRASCFTAPAACTPPTPATPKWHGAKGMTAQKRGRSRPSILPAFNTAGLATVLRRMHPTDTAHAVEADLKGAITWQTVRNWLEERNAIRGDHLMVLVAVYGPQILTAAWPDGWGALPGWLDTAKLAAERAALDAEIERLETRRLALAARLQERR